MSGDSGEEFWSPDEDTLSHFNLDDFYASVKTYLELNNHSNSSESNDHHPRDGNWTYDGSGGGNRTGNWWDSLGPPCQLKLTTRHIILIVCFTIIFTLSVIGNCLVIVTIAQNRWMRTVTNIFLQSLAISDLLLSVICMPPTLTAMLFQCFLWGQAMCKLIMYLQPVSVAASAYTLVAIALERYNAICRPLHSRHWKTKSHAVKMIVTVWVISLLCSSPSLFMYNLVEIRPGQYNCRDDSGGGSGISSFYTLFLFLVLFVVPLVLMIVLYAAVTYTLWRGIKLDSSITSNGETSTGSPTEEHSSVRSSAASMRHRLSTSKPMKAWSRLSQSIRTRSMHCSGGSSGMLGTNRRASSRRSSAFLDCPTTTTTKSPPNYAIGDTHHSQHKLSTSTTPDSRLLASAGPVLRCTHSAKNLEAKKRVIIMLFAIVVEFLMCWSPLYAYQALFQFKYIVHFDAYLYTFFVVLAYLSSCSNPITYCFLNLKFRQAFLLAFGCRFLVKEAPMLYQMAGTARRNPQHSQQQQLQHHLTVVRRGGPGGGNSGAGGSGAALNGSRYDLSASAAVGGGNHQGAHPTADGHSSKERAIDSLVVQCHQAEKPLPIPLLQLRTPTTGMDHNAGASSVDHLQQHRRHLYEATSEASDDDELLVNTPPKSTPINEKGRIPTSPSTPITNGNRTSSMSTTPVEKKNKLKALRSTPSPSPVQEKLTSV